MEVKILNTSFQFTGVVSIKEDSWKKEGTTKSGYDYLSLNFGIKADDHNMVYIEAFGMMSDSIRYYDIEKQENVEVLYSAREKYNDKGIYRTNVGGEIKRFISNYDFVKYLADHEAEFKNKVVTVYGQTSRNPYNGQIITRYQFNSLMVIDESEKDSVNKEFTVTPIIYFTKDSIDTADWKKEGVIRINGFTSDYINDKDHNVKGERYCAQAITIKLKNKIDEKTLDKINVRFASFGVKINEDNSISCSLKDKTIYSNKFICAVFNGSEEVEFDESMLTPTQKNAIKAGLISIEDCKPKSNIYGSRVTEWKFRRAVYNDKIYMGDYVKEDMKIDEFDKLIYSPLSLTESADDMIEPEKALDDAEEILFD